MKKENDTIWFKIIKMKNERKKNSLIWDYEEGKWYNLIQDYKDENPKARKTVWFEIMKKENDKSDSRL